MLKSRSRSLLTGAAALAAGIAVTMPQAALGSTSSASPPSAHRAVVDAAPAIARHPATAGPAALAEHTFLVTLPSRNPAGESVLARAVSQPGNPRFRHFLTPAQYTSEFAPTATDASAAARWLRGQGLTVLGRNPQNAYLRVRGTTAAIDRAFATRLATVRADGQQFTAPAQDMTVPAAVKGVIAGVAGLDTVPLQTQHMTAGLTLAQVKTQLVRNGSPAASRLRELPASVLDQTPALAGGCAQYYGQERPPDLPPGSVGPSQGTQLSRTNCGYTPAQVDTALGISQTGMTGRGVTVGIVLWCDYPTIDSDLAEWAKLVHARPFSSGQYTVIPPAGGYNTTDCSGTSGAEDGIEQALDAEAIHGVAPDAKIVYAPGGDDNLDSVIPALHSLIDTHLVDVVTNSYGEVETLVDSGDLSAVDAVLQEAAVEGITVLAGSGDDGDNSTITTTGTPDPLFPASDPWITATGGAAVGLSSSSRVEWVAPWFTAESEEENSAWSSSYLLGGAGGGGTSQEFAEPWYQDGVVPSSLAGTTPSRVVPDLVNLAAPDTGYLVGTTAITNYALVPTNNFAMESVGGTSLASPLTAGQVADVIQQNGGHTIGFLNPVIYSAKGKGLTDLSDNNPSYSSDLSENLDGIADISVEVVEGGQSLIQQSLSVAPGYNNLSGLGAITSQAAFARMLLM
jgi:subtilase family serine protease